MKVKIFLSAIIASVVCNVHAASRVEIQKILTDDYGIFSTNTDPTNSIKLITTNKMPRKHSPEIYWQSKKV